MCNCRDAIWHFDVDFVSHNIIQLNRPVSFVENKNKIVQKSAFLSLVCVDW